MDFDWSNPPFSPKDAPTIQQIEESLEDPHGLRFFPDSPRFASESRTFSMGRTLTDQGIFTVFRSDGKKVRVIAARTMTEEEDNFYDRKAAQWK